MSRGQWSSGPWSLVLLCGCLAGCNSKPPAPNPVPGSVPQAAAPSTGVQGDATQAANAQPADPSQIALQPTAPRIQQRPVKPFDPQAAAAAQANDARLRAALGETLAAFKRSGSRTEAFTGPLRSIASVLPEMQVSAGDQPLTWNSVTLNTQRQQIDAVRFKSPLSVPADMHWVYVARGTHNWSILPVSGQMGGFSRFVEAEGLQIEGAALPEDNFAIFQSLGNGQIQPGQEYLLWFVTDPQTVPMQLAIRLKPASQEFDDSSLDSITAALGVKIQPRTFEPTPAGLQQAYRFADLLSQKGRSRSKAVVQAMQSVAPALPEVRAVATGKPAEWQTVPRAPGGGAFDAMRFRSPLDVPADLYVVLAMPSGQSVTWNIIAEEGTIPLFGPGTTMSKLQFAGLPPSQKNAVTFIACPGGHIAPNRDYILYFHRKEQVAFPRQFLLTVVPTGSQPPRVGNAAIARICGLEYPAVAAAEGSRILQQHGDTVTGLAWPAGKDLISTCIDGTTHLWNLSKEKGTHWSAPGGEQTWGLRASAAGDLLAIHSIPSGKIVVADAATGKRRAEFDLPPGKPIGFAFSADGREVAAYGEQSRNDFTGKGEAVVRDVKVANNVARIPVSGPIIQHIQFSHDKAVLFTGSGARTQQSTAAGILLRTASITQPPTEILSDPAEHFYISALSSDDSRVATTSYYGLVKLWDLPQRKQLAVVSVPGPVAALALAPDATQVAVGTSDGWIHVWTPGVGRAKSLAAHYGTANHLAFSADGKQLASAGSDGTVRLHDLSVIAPADTPASEQNSLGMALVSIPAGEFDMGTADDFKYYGGYERDLQPQRPRHRVRITRPFRMSAHEVTVGQFRRFVQATGYKTTAQSSPEGGSHMVAADSGYRSAREFVWTSPGFAQADDHPVVQVSYLDALAFCAWLGKQEKAVYRLPTEAEWEHAARAGNPEEWSCGSFPGVLTVGNVADRSLLTVYKRYPVASSGSDQHALTAPVGSYAPNAWGLYDMHGNVFEWCADWFDPKYYASSPAVDPRGPEQGENHVQRGGCFLYHVYDSRAGNRDFGPPGQAQSSLGFRVVKELAK